jgi:hypothetical protein
MSVENLSNWLEIGKATADLIIRYAKEDMVLVSNGMHMRDNQCTSDYLVCFSRLALCCSWGEPALKYRFYKGLPPWIKDDLSKSKKPWTLQVLKQKVQNINARYWEQAQEHSCEQQYRQNPSKLSTSTASAVLTITLKPAPHSDFRSEQKPKPKDLKPSTPRVVNLILKAS